MAKTGFLISYITRSKGSNLSDLLAIHQTQFPMNQLAIWEGATHIVVKVSNVGEVQPKIFQAAKAEVGYVEVVS